MKAAVTRAFGAPLVIEELELAPPGPGEIEVATKAVAICHSDIIYTDGGWGGEPPLVLGHEAAGEVLTVGAGVEDLAPGDRVCVTLIRGCGHCPCCAAGHMSHCKAPFPLNARSPLIDAAGKPVGQGLKTAAFAERMVVAREQAAKLTGDIGWAQASLLSCGVITGYGAVTNAAGLRPGASAVVIGAGGVGLNAVQGAALSGAGQVVVVDISAEKLEIAPAFGATHTVNASDPDAVKQVRRITGGADFVFVTVGATVAMAQAYQMLGIGGAAVLVGMPPSGHMSEIDPLLLADAGQKIIGSKMGQARVSVDIPMLEQSYYDGRLKLDELVTGRFSFDDINAAMDATRAGKGVRNVIELE